MLTIVPALVTQNPQITPISGEKVIWLTRSFTGYALAKTPHIAR